MLATGDEGVLVAICVKRNGADPRLYPRRHPFARVRQLDHSLGSRDRLDIRVSTCFTFLTTSLYIPPAHLHHVCCIPCAFLSRGHCCPAELRRGRSPARDSPRCSRLVSGTASHHGQAPQNRKHHNPIPIHRPSEISAKRHLALICIRPSSISLEQSRPWVQPESVRRPSIWDV